MKTLKGRRDAMAVDTVQNLPAEVETLTDTFRITVKDDSEEPVVKYENDKEQFSYHKVPSLQTALEYFGASLTEDQKTFISEALKGSEETGKAVAKIVDIINDDLRVSAKNNAYQRVFNEHKPLTEENLTNANASIVRNFMKTQNVSDETAIATLKEYKVIPAEFTVAEYRGNKGKR